MTFSPDHNPDMHNETDETIGEVLTSIRRILHEEADTATTEHDNGELKLDASMMVKSPSASATSATTVREPEAHEELMAANTIAAAERSLDALHAALSRKGGKPVSGNTVISNASNLTIEDMVRMEVREMVRTWLDSHLPSMVEIMVRAEIAKLRTHD